MKLHLGVYEVPYTSTDEGEKDAITTGGVAEILEGKYHIMETFSELHELEIADAMAEAMAGAFETVAMGGRVASPFAEGTSKIDDMFKTFLATGEMEETATPGVPTKASIRRRSLRFKSKKAENPRPSFIDTGLYQASFVSWVEGADIGSKNG